MRSSSDGRRKRHHTIPKFLLREFATDDGDLYEFDLEFLTVRSKKPGQIAHSTEFYTIDNEDGPSDEIETVLAVIEDRAAHVMRKLKGPKITISARELDALVMLVALQRQRVPAQRDHMLEYMSRVEAMSRAAATSHGLDPDEATEEIRAELDFTRSRNFTNPFILQSLTTVFRLMRRRGWGILRRAQGVPSFIISDNPVVISDLREDTGPPYFPLIPYGEDSKITMPISADAVLVSYYDPSLSREGFVNQNAVELVNQQQLLNASKRVYGSEPNFVWLRDGITPYTWEDVVRIERSEA